MQHRGYDLSNKHPFRLLQGRLGIYDKYKSNEHVLDNELTGVYN